MGSNYKRRVVIIQPHMTKSALEAAREEQDRQRGKEVISGPISRIRQLDTLLISTEAACRDMGAELLVLGDGSTRRSRKKKPNKKAKGTNP